MTGVAPTGPLPDRWTVYLSVQREGGRVRGKVTVWWYQHKRPAGHEEVVELFCDADDTGTPVDAIPRFYELLGAWEKRVSAKLKSTD